MTVWLLFWRLEGGEPILLVAIPECTLYIPLSVCSLTCYFNRGPYYNIHLDGKTSIFLFQKLGTNKD